MYNSTGSCTERGTTDLVETDEEVRIVTRLVDQMGVSECPAEGRQLQHRVDLDRPLDDRQLTGCLRPECRPLQGSDGVASLAVDGLDGDVVLAGTIVRPDGEEGEEVVIAGPPGDFAPAVRWVVDGEAPVAEVMRGDGAGLLVTQDTEAGAGVVASVRVRALESGDLLGGGQMRESTRLGDAGRDAERRLVGVGRAGPTLIAVDPLTGRARWQIDADSVGIDTDEVLRVRLADPFTALVVTADRIHALAVADGSPRWDVAMAGLDHQASVLVADQLVVVAGADGVRRAHDLTDGALRWSTPVVTDQRFPVPMPATPTAVDEVLVVGIDDGAVGVDLATGDRPWHTTLVEALEG